jgi:hypothetical protein
MQRSTGAYGGRRETRLSHPALAIGEEQTRRNLDLAFLGVSFIENTV